jgi:hypothetical protein
VSNLSKRTASVSRLVEWAERGRLYAIVDATDTPSVPERATRMGEARAVSLYRGSAEETFSAIAPYLLQVDWPVLEWLTGTLWPTPWGIFALADAPLEALRTHFRKFLTVRSPDGEPWYFRFYDPRVLPAYLDSCDEAQTTAFFGPVLAYGVTDLDTYGVTLLAPGWDRVPITQQPPASVAIQL